MEVNATARRHIVTELRTLAATHRRERDILRSLAEDLDHLETVTDETPPIDTTTYREQARLCEEVAPLYDDAAACLENEDDPDTVLAIIDVVRRLMNLTVPGETEIPDREEIVPDSSATHD